MAAPADGQQQDCGEGQLKESDEDEDEGSGDAEEREDEEDGEDSESNEDDREEDLKLIVEYQHKILRKYTMLGMISYSDAPQFHDLVDKRDYKMICLFEVYAQNRSEDDFLENLGLCAQINKEEEEQEDEEENELEQKRE